MAQVGHTDPTLTLRIYQPLLKRTAATGSGDLDPNLDPNSVLDPHGHD